jgi:hypothetical protein
MLKVLRPVWHHWVRWEARLDAAHASAPEASSRDWVQIAQACVHTVPASRQSCLPRRNGCSAHGDMSTILGLVDTPADGYLMGPSKMPPCEMSCTIVESMSCVFSGDQGEPGQCQDAARARPDRRCVAGRQAGSRGAWPGRGARGSKPRRQTAGRVNIRSSMTPACAAALPREPALCCCARFDGQGKGRRGGGSG